jgi:hypothetical protein
MSARKRSPRTLEARDDVHQEGEPIRVSQEAERRLQILDRFREVGAFDVGGGSLCQACVEVVGVTGAGILLMAGSTMKGTVCTTDATSEAIELLQFSLGEGPCVDAFHQSRPVLEPDLAQPDVVRWVAFTAPAVAAGARAVFGFPLRVGDARIGALNLYRDRVGGLSDSQLADALVVSGIVAETILAAQAGAPPGQLAAEISSGADLRDVVHQASGMVSVQLDVTVDEALSRLRAHAFAHDLVLTDVAKAVVARRLRFDAHGDEDWAGDRR